VVLDGAHNPQKMAALIEDLRGWRASHALRRLIVVVGVLESKRHDAMLAQIATVADEILTTSPRVLAKPGTTAEEMARSAREQGFAGPVTASADPADALESAMCTASPSDLVVVTGSLYLVGNVRGRWYPDDEVVIQRTAWPS